MEAEMIGVCNLGEAIARRYYEAGIELGMKLGISIGENRLSELMARLFAMNRIDDIKRCTKDAEYRNKLYREFQLV